MRNVAGRAMLGDPTVNSNYPGINLGGIKVALCVVTKVPADLDILRSFCPVLYACYCGLVLISQTVDSATGYETFHSK